MKLRNTKEQFGLVAVLLHWLMAVIIIALIIVGLYMVQLPVSLRKLKLYGWHKEYGILILMLAILRISWRLSSITPLLPAHMPVYEKIGARSAHYTFYIMMFAMPLTGWMISSAAGLPVSFFGLFVLPDLVSPNADLQAFLTMLHKWLGYGLIILICLHTTAALQHHFYYKDNLLRRMLT